MTKLKEQDGQDLAIFGHGLLAQTLLEHGRTDQLRLAVHPVLAGNGKLLSGQAERHPCVLHYQLALLPHSGLNRRRCATSDGPAWVRDTPAETRRARRGLG